MIGGEALLDLDYGEDSRAEVDMNFVMTGSKKMVEVQATAEGRPFGQGEFALLIDLARRGIHTLTEQQQHLLKMKFRGAS